MNGGMKTNCGGQFCPSTLCVPGIRLRLLGGRHIYLLSHGLLILPCKDLPTNLSFLISPIKTLPGGPVVSCLSPALSKTNQLPSTL